MKSRFEGKEMEIIRCLKTSFGRTTIPPERNRTKEEGEKVEEEESRLITKLLLARFVV